MKMMWRDVRDFGREGVWMEVNGNQRFGLIIWYDFYFSFVLLAQLFRLKTKMMMTRNIISVIVVHVTAVMQGYSQQVYS